MIVIKKPIPVEIRFADKHGELETLEGVTHYECGDAIATGVMGEHWAISRALFDDTYLPIPPTRNGEPGSYLKKPIPVEAMLIDSDSVVKLAKKRGVLAATAGNWLITDLHGEQWVVRQDVFEQTYEEQKA